MILTNHPETINNACENPETAKCTCNTIASDRQELWELRFTSPSSDSIYYEESQVCNNIDDAPFKPCRSVHTISENTPVEIRDESTISVDLPPISWHGYNSIPKYLNICNAGRNVLINGQWPNGKPYIQGGPLNGSYIFSQIHFHAPSEHEIDGKRYPLEMHVVHYKTSYLTQEKAMEEKDGTIVLVYFFQVRDSSDTVLSSFTKDYQLKGAPRRSEITGIPLNHIVKPFFSHYYIYWGSITTRKKSYLLQWIINCSNLYATKQEVYDLFHLMDCGNSNGRRVPLMKPLNNAVYYAGGYTSAFLKREEAAIQSSSCNVVYVPTVSQSCQTFNIVQTSKKDIEVQVASSENCTTSNSGFYKLRFEKLDVPKGQKEPMPFYVLEKESNKRVKMSESKESNFVTETWSNCSVKQDLFINECETCKNQHLEKKSKCKKKKSKSKCSSENSSQDFEECLTCRNENYMVVEPSSKSQLSLTNNHCNCHCERDHVDVHLEKKKSHSSKESSLHNLHECHNHANHKCTHSHSHVCGKNSHSGCQSHKKPKKKTKLKKKRSKCSVDLEVDECQKKKKTKTHKCKDLKLKKSRSSEKKITIEETTVSSDSESGGKSKRKIKTKKKEKENVNVKDGPCESKSHHSKSKTKVKVSASDKSVKKDKKDHCESPSQEPINYILTPSTVKKAPRVPRVAYKTDEKKHEHETDTKVCNFLLSEESSSAFASTYRLPQLKTKEPLKEFFLQTEHLFHTEKKGGFSMCTSQDYYVTIVYNQNVIQEFRGTFAPNKLRLGNSEKLHLTPKYPEPENVSVHLEDCIVKMEALNKIYIRAKFLLKPSVLNLSQIGKSGLIKRTETEPKSVTLLSNKPKMKFLNSRETYLYSIQDSDQSKSLNKPINQRLSVIEKKKPSIKSIQKKKEIKKQEYEIELLKKPPVEVETSKSNIFDTNQPNEAKIKRAETQNTLAENHDITLKNLYPGSKKGLLFANPHTVKFESCEERQKSGTLKIINEVNDPSEKNLLENNALVPTGKFLGIMNKNFVPYSKSGEKDLRCDTLTEDNDTILQPLVEVKESDKSDSQKNTVLLYHYDPENLKSKSSQMKIKDLTLQDKNTVITSDVGLPENIASRKSTTKSPTIKEEAVKAPDVISPDISNVKKSKISCPSIKLPALDSLIPEVTTPPESNAPNKMEGEAVSSQDSQKNGKKGFNSMIPISAKRKRK